MFTREISEENQQRFYRFQELENDIAIALQIAQIALTLKIKVANKIHPEFNCEKCKKFSDCWGKEIGFYFSPNIESKTDKSGCVNHSEND